MRNLLRWRVWGWITILALVSCVVQSKGNPRAHDASVRDKLIGGWRLARIELQGADGKTTKLERTGILVYTRDGHMSVQIMAPKAGSPAASGPIQYEQGGYEAYYGTYEINEKAHTVTHHVEGALVRALVGSKLTRKYRFSGEQLVLTSSRSDEHWTIGWEHY